MLGGYTKRELEDELYDVRQALESANEINRILRNQTIRLERLVRELGGDPNPEVELPF